MMNMPPNNMMPPGGMTPRPSPMPARQGMGSPGAMPGGEEMDEASPEKVRTLALTVLGRIKAVVEQAGLNFAELVDEVGGMKSKTVPPPVKKPVAPPEMGGGGMPGGMPPGAMLDGM